MTVLWDAEMAQRATGGFGPRGWQAMGIRIDSRHIAPGDLFVALHGPNHDAHNYVLDALEAGAAAAMVSRVPKGLATNAPLLVVKDTLVGLGALGQAARARLQGKVIALTGSVGKTGTKEMLRHALAGQGETAATVGNLNNHIGVPLTLARLPAAAKYAMVELGMNHAGEIGPLSRMTRPHVALITRIAPAHTEFFASLRDLAAAKAEIFEGLEPGAVAVINADDGFTTQLAEAARTAGAARVLTFGEAAAADARLCGANVSGRCSFIEAEIFGRRLSYHLGVPGRHWAMNSLGALAAAASAGANLSAAAESLADVRPPPGRGTTEKLALPQGEIVLIDESYNASPAAVEAAFAMLVNHSPEPPGRRIAVLGDMLELGANAPAEHATLGQKLARLAVDLVYTVGRESRALAAELRTEQRAEHADRSEEIARVVLEDLKEGDVVLVKGSLGIAMTHVVRALRDVACQHQREIHAP